MSKESGVILLGIFIVILPFLGFPQALRDDFYILAGLGLIAIGIFLRADHLKREAGIDATAKSSPPVYGAENGTTRKISDITPSE